MVEQSHRPGDGSSHNVGDPAIFNSLGACWLHAMLAIDRLHEQCGAKRVTVRGPKTRGSRRDEAKTTTCTPPQRDAHT